MKPAQRPLPSSMRYSGSQCQLLKLPITPTAHVPLWKGTPVTVEVAGQVPSEDLREAAIRLVEREASQLGPEVHVESRIGIVPTMARRSA